MTFRTKDDVVRAAGRLFAERGFHGTSMRDLGSEVGLLGSSLYSHVGGKNELLVEVIRTGADLFSALARRVDEAGGSAKDRLRALISGHVSIVLDHLDEARTFLNEARFLPDDARAEVLAMRDEYERAYRSTIEDGEARGDLRRGVDAARVSILILSMVNSVDRWYRPDGSSSPSEVADSIFEFALEGIGR